MPLAQIATINITNDIVRALVPIEEACEGVRKAFEYAPTAPTPLPCFVNFVEGMPEIVAPRMMGLRESVHQVRAVLLVALQADSADAERTARALMPTFVHALDQHKTLDDEVRGAEVIEAAVVSAEYGPLTLQAPEQPYLGVSFDVRVRCMETVTYASSG